ncbi:MAG TPA: hypothetical protein VM690_00750 [Gaiellaceae bacterium]|nr:hypothetical protein [Gaiellaceae bacterium]
MRRLAVLFAASLVLVAAGCGGSSSKAGPQSHSVAQVSKVFFDAGLAFSSEIVPNRYVTGGQQVFLPLALNSSDMRYNVLAQLSGSNTTTHTGIDVWVFDTDKHANDALKIVPLKEWGGGVLAITRAQLGNVVVIAAGFVGTKKAPLDKALSALK